MVRRPTVAKTEASLQYLLMGALALSRMQSLLDRFP